MIIIIDQLYMLLPLYLGFKYEPTCLFTSLNDFNLTINTIVLLIFL